MCMICTPACDMCRPKFVICPSCGKRANIMFPMCVFCKEPVTDAMKAQAQADWEALHPDRVESARGRSHA